jgi:hypothetical protein
MRIAKVIVFCSVVLGSVVLPATARAQVAFPAESTWRPLRCGATPVVLMNDGVADQAGAIDERDIVGSEASPAALRSADTTNLFLRLRVEGDPAPGGALRASAWIMLFDLDGDRSSYELMIAADGIGNAAGTVSLYRNTVLTQRGDPRDPADVPAVVTFPFAMNGRVVPVSSNFGNDGDYFVDFAVPWSELARVGLDRTTPTYVWAGTSSVAGLLDADLACHNGASGPPGLDTTSSDQTTGDPAQDPADPGNGGVGQLEGGGGCAASGAGAGVGTVIAALGLCGVLGARRRRRAR